MQIKKYDANLLGICLAFVATVALVKLVVFLLDPLPMFYLGDSMRYLETVFRGFIPPERSFVYGFVIKVLTSYSHSLTSLVFLQVWASAISAFLLGYILYKYFFLKPWLAFFFGVLCAIEPLQLFYERYVMTEAFTLLFFSIYVTLVFSYLKQPRAHVLALAQVAALCVICFRVFYLPIIVITAACLPLFVVLVPSGAIKLPFFKNDKRLSLRKAVRPNGVLKFLVLHLMISLGLTFFLQNGYRHLNGYLSDNYPTYNYDSGLVLLAVWSPIAEPQDFPIPEMAEKIFDVTLDPKQKLNRAAHYIWPNQLADNIRRLTAPDHAEANRLAKQTAWNAVKRDPVGWVALIWSDYVDYLTPHELRHWMVWDRGVTPLPKKFLEDLQNFFGLAAEKFPQLTTLTNVLFYNAWPWFIFLALSPFVAFVTFIIVPAEVRGASLIIFVYLSMVIGLACIANAQTTVRYIHASSWLCFLGIAPLCARLTHQFNEQGHAGEND